MEQKIIKGYKVFNPDWTCRGFQYEIGKSYEIEESPICRKKGFHFCKKLNNCFNDYSFKIDNKVAEIEAYGDIDEDINGRSCTNKIRIIRELTWHEVLDLCNSGNHNSGRHNSNDYNSGNFNSGRKNFGDFNSGSYNDGDHNSGNYNKGSFNTIDFNKGWFNSGSYNSGSYNSGNHNSGQRNSGDYNSDNFNSGCHNLGYNNSGDWNSCDSSSGIFNTKESTILMFNKPSNWTLEMWHESKANRILKDMPMDYLYWTHDYEMDDDEKVNNPDYETTEGYLKSVAMNSRQEWWHKLNQNARNAILSLPNFNKEIFKEITGINVDL